MKALDEFQRTLNDLQHALSAMNGTIGQISFDPNDRNSVDKAVAQMEAMIDERVAPYVTNPMVTGIVRQAKSSFAAQLRERAIELSVTDVLTENAIDSASRIEEQLYKESERRVRPRAFISHASADTERVARPLDAMLRVRGIETWLDERDLLPGQNLIDQIFSHGISKSDAFIVILSDNSVDRPWVHEELSVAIVHRIAGMVKRIIPVVLDGVTPPAALAATVWESVKDLHELERHADRIAASVLGSMPAPVAVPPSYAGVSVHQLPNLGANDERIFAAACEQVLENQDYYPLVNVSQLFNYGTEIGMTQEQIVESIAALEQNYYFKDALHTIGQQWPVATGISYSGLERYLEAYRPDQYRQAKQSVLSAIVNENAHSQRMIAQRLHIHEAIVAHILEGLERGGHARVARHSGGATIMPKPTLQRLLREI